MRVLITGARGFIGRALADSLLAGGLLGPDGAPARAVSELLAIDLAPADSHGTDARLRPVVGDAGDATLLARAFERPIDVVFALGASLTHEAEAEFERGLRVNVQSVLQLIAACRTQPRAPRVVFSSSIAAFGGALPDTVTDDVPRTPQTSYGTHKAIVELLLHDASRKGYVDGCALRLPIVLTRPGPLVPSISGRLAALIREPLAGRDAVCPLASETRIVVSSVQAVARALCALATVPGDALGPSRALNLPSLSVRIGELVEAVQGVPQRRADVSSVGRIAWQPDAALQAIVAQWPRRFDSARARALGIVGSPSIDQLIDDFIDSQRAPTP